VKISKSISLLVSLVSTLLVLRTTLVISNEKPVYELVGTHQGAQTFIYQTSHANNLLYMYITELLSIFILVWLIKMDGGKKELSYFSSKPLLLFAVVFFHILFYLSDVNRILLIFSLLTMTSKVSYYKSTQDNISISFILLIPFLFSIFLAFLLLFLLNLIGVGTVFVTYTLTDNPLIIGLLIYFGVTILIITGRLVHLLSQEIT
jgi:hypothetical protein